jgi:hypothetical protein
MPLSSVNANLVIGIGEIGPVQTAVCGKITVAAFQARA